MKFLDLNGLTVVLSKLLNKVAVVFDGLEERVTANETALKNKLDKKGGTIGSEEKWDLDSWGITGNGNQTLSGFEEIEANYISVEEIRPKNGTIGFYGGDVCFDDAVEFEGEVKFSYYGIESVTNTSLSAEPGQIYVYAKSVPISSLDVTLTEIKSSKGNEFTVKFTPAIDDMPISITDNTSDDILWHNEPKVIAGKAYTLCINITGEYKEAVLSYAE